MISAKRLPPPDDILPVRRALLSVFDKTGLVPFAQCLREHGVELISTGGTARALRDAGLPVCDVSEITGYPEILDGRVKTLHPAVHGGLLARRNDPEDTNALKALSIAPIELVVVNLYPFENVVSEEVTEAEAVENIDIGGPTMIRAAAKNYFFTGVATSPAQYEAIAAELAERAGGLTMATRRALAQEAFRRTGTYDRAIANWFAESNAAEEDLGASGLPHNLPLHLPRKRSLRYGENPHQQAAVYGDAPNAWTQIHGKELSFNNLIDLDAALRLMEEFGADEPACAILKHTNPCGVAVADTLEDAWAGAFATDRQSPFGGIVIVNNALDQATAEAIDSIFTEIVIAPEFETGATALLKQKKNRRLIRLDAAARETPTLDLRSLAGHILAQTIDAPLPPPDAVRARWQVATERAPDAREWRDLDFAWRVVKHVKSNAIVYARHRRTIGIGAGQMSRIDASEIAVAKGKKSELDFNNSVIASDAFFPFADGLTTAAQSGARAVIQPGGSLRDHEVTAAANENGMAMVHTGIRHFRH